MQILAKIIHLLSLGLWAGGVTFFSLFTALPVIRRLEQLALSKPDWLTGLTEQQQGTRLAGIALSAAFDRYFYFQIVCGALALATALVWVPLQGAAHKLRVVLLAVALLLVLTNTFVFYPRVSQLRHERYAPETAVAERAGKEFGAWHTYSLLTDMAGLVLVLVALGMGVLLPRPGP